ncbi:MAG TPA: hypothetical protein VGB19_14085 [Actinomycetota bacterium]
MAMKLVVIVVRIVNGSLTSADYKNNNIRSVDVADDTVLNGGLTGADVKIRAASTPACRVSGTASCASGWRTLPACSLKRSLT